MQEFPNLLIQCARQACASLLQSGFRVPYALLQPMDEMLLLSQLQAQLPGLQLQLRHTRRDSHGRDPARNIQLLVRIGRQHG